MAESLRDKTIQSLKKVFKNRNNQDPSYKWADDLINLIKSDKITSDEELAKYLAVNRSFFERNIPGFGNDKAWDDFKDIAYTEPNWGVERDIVKESKIPDIVERFPNNISVEELKQLSKKLNISYSDLNNKLRDMRIAKDREYIAHGGEWTDIFNKDKWTETPWNGLIDNPIVQNPLFKNIGGAALNLLAPRTQEAIESGDEPTVKDYAGDAIQNIGYSLPTGFGTNLVSKGIVKAGSKVLPKATNKVSSMLGGRVGDWGKIGVSNSVVPAAVEAADVALYDEDNPRGEYSLLDVGTGTLTNIMTPMILRGIVARGGRISDDKGARSMWDNWGSSESTRDLGKYLIERNKIAEGVTNHPAQYGYLERKAAAPDIALREYVKQDGKLSERLNGLDEIAGGIIKEIKSDLGTLTVTPGRNFNEKLKNSGLSDNINDPNYVKILKDSYLNLPPEVQIRSESALPVRTLIGQEEAKNFITNKAGDYLYENNMITPRVPVVGAALNGWMKERDAEARRNQSIKEAADKYYGANFLLGY